MEIVETKTVIVGARPERIDPPNGCLSVTIQNEGRVPIRVGSPLVESGKGYRLLPDGAITFDSQPLPAIAVAGEAHGAAFSVVFLVD